MSPLDSLFIEFVDLQLWAWAFYWAWFDISMQYPLGIALNLVPVALAAGGLWFLRRKGRCTT